MLPLLSVLGKLVPEFSTTQPGQDNLSRLRQVLLGLPAADLVVLCSQLLISRSILTFVLSFFLPLVLYFFYPEGIYEIYSV